MCRTEPTFGSEGWLMRIKACAFGNAAALEADGGLLVDLYPCC